MASRHDPLNIGQGEPGMDNSGDNDSINNSEPTDSFISSPNKSPVRKRKLRNDDEVDMSTMLRSVVDAYNSLNGKNKPFSKPSHTPTEELPLQDLYNLIGQHKFHLFFCRITVFAMIWKRRLSYRI